MGQAFCSPQDEGVPARASRVETQPMVKPVAGESSLEDEIHNSEEFQSMANQVVFLSSQNSKLEQQLDQCREKLKKFEESGGEGQMRMINYSQEALSSVGFTSFDFISNKIGVADSSDNKMDEEGNASLADTIIDRCQLKHTLSSNELKKLEDLLSGYSPSPLTKSKLLKLLQSIGKDTSQEIRSKIVLTAAVIALYIEHSKSKTELDLVAVYELANTLGQTHQMVQNIEAVVNNELKLLDACQKMMS